MMNKIRKFWNDEQGQGMTEYGLVLGLIAVAVVTSLIALRGHIIGLFDNAEDTVNQGVTEMGATP
ncbi:pilus assembly protein Flp/PilA [Paenibacillus phyllosphaerae]|uniref:Pilus assembly protein Flp/PilA n=1 Tax=Paenibacillus phyllosphaerae TaxID=274593 RepID=A0A7W5B3M7_9BACL|nr:Flp family type IVb pilin [Paenibacillus phyllosphaerae]MBB3113819.1 pilus assembly protein Flp/PilA [Paenibacillus phyllosphaerae]MBB3113820.1 pilus assembly protein Flp/PilA [Paenibacillus phyllosphaerae]